MAPIQPLCCNPGVDAVCCQYPRVFVLHTVGNFSGLWQTPTTAEASVIYHGLQDWSLAPGGEVCLLEPVPRCPGQVSGVSRAWQATLQMHVSVNRYGSGYPDCHLVWECLRWLQILNLFLTPGAGMCQEPGQGIPVQERHHMIWWGQLHRAWEGGHQ